MEERNKKFTEDVKPKSQFAIIRKEVAYDINTLPEKMTLKDVEDTFTKTGILPYDAAKGIAPSFINKEK